MEILRKNQKEMPEIKDTETEMKNDGFISRLEMADVRISELEGISIKNSKTEKEENDWNNQNRISNNLGTPNKAATYM